MYDHFIKHSRFLAQAIALGLTVACGGLETHEAVEGPSHEDESSALELSIWKLVYSSKSQLHVKDGLTGVDKTLPMTGLQPALSRDRSKITYVRSGNIYTAKIDGTGEKQITTGEKASSPSFSPDGSRIVFLSGDLGGGYANNVYTVASSANKAGKQSWWPVTNISFWAYGPKYAASGTIGFMFGILGSGSEIVLVDALQSNQDPDSPTWRVLDLGNDVGSPDFSDDGAKVAFTTASGTCGQSAIGVASFDSSGNTWWDVELACDPKFHATHPDFRGNTKIAYSRWTYNSMQIYSTTTSWSEPTEIKVSGSSPSAASWQ